MEIEMATKWNHDIWVH